MPTRRCSYASQTLQGADILAKTTGAQVLMPDFLGEGGEITVDRVPAKTEEDKKALQKFFSGSASPPTIAPQLVDFVKLLKAEGVEKAGCIGYCWGNL